jgi:hypothetical protein
MYSIDNIEVFILIACILFLIIHTTEKKSRKYESWINYREEPLGNIKTIPSDTSSFYRRDRYRKPYNWPVCQMTNYPIRHCKHLP